MVFCLKNATLMNLQYLCEKQLSHVLLMVTMKTALCYDHPNYTRLSDSKSSLQ